MSAEYHTFMSSFQAYFIVIHNNQKSLIIKYMYNIHIYIYIDFPPSLDSQSEETINFLLLYHAFKYSFIYIILLVYKIYVLVY